MRFSRPEVFRIVGLTALLVFLLVTGRPCADSVSRFVTSFSDSGSAAAPLPRAGTVDVPSGGASSGAGSDLERYEPLRPGMSEAELKAAIERARARARGVQSHPGGAGETAGRDDRPGPAAPSSSSPPRAQ
jgi:hypothetical protein